MAEGPSNVRAEQPANSQHRAQEENPGRTRASGQPGSGAHGASAASRARPDPPPPPTGACAVQPGSRRAGEPARCAAPRRPCCHLNVAQHAGRDSVLSMRAGGLGRRAPRCWLLGNGHGEDAGDAGGGGCA